MLLSRARSPQRDRGFTLIELLVVVIIVGVLAAIAIPVYLRQREKAVEASLKADMRQARMLLQNRALERGTPGVGATTCFTATTCAAAGGPTPLLTGTLDMKFSDGNTVGDFWGSDTFHLCLEHHTNGVPDKWIAYRTWGAGVDLGSGTGECPWTAINVPN